MKNLEKTVVKTYSVNGCALTLSHVRSNGLDYYVAEIVIVLAYKQDILEPSAEVFSASGNGSKAALRRLGHAIAQVRKALGCTGDYRNAKRLNGLSTELLGLADSLPYGESQAPSTAA